MVGRGLCLSVKINHEQHELVSAMRGLTILEVEAARWLIWAAAKDL
jgi:hypothetical protein